MKPYKRHGMRANGFDWHARSVEAWGLYTFFLEILVNYVYFHVWCNNFWLSNGIIIVTLVGVLGLIFGTDRTVLSLWHLQLNSYMGCWDPF